MMFAAELYRVRIGLSVGSLRYWKANKNRNGVYYMSILQEYEQIRKQIAREIGE